MKYKVEVWDEVNHSFIKIIDTNTLNIPEEDWFLLTSDEKISVLTEEMYYLTTAFDIKDIKYKQVT